MANEKWAVQVGDRVELISSDLATILGFKAPEPGDVSHTAIDDSRYKSATILLCDGLAAGLSGDAAAIFAIAKRTERQAAQDRAYLSSSAVNVSSGKNFLQTLLGR